MLILMVPFALGFYALAYRSILGVRQQNVETNITRQTNQYVTTQQQALVQKMVDYQRIGADNPGQPPTAQQRAIVTEMRLVAAMLTPDRIPAEVAAFLAARP